MVLGIIIGLVVGGILGYAFRGKENAALKQVGAEAVKLTGDVQKKL